MAGACLQPQVAGLLAKVLSRSRQSDIVVMDVAAKKFTQITDFDGHDSWPMWGTIEDLFCQRS